MTRALVDIDDEALAAAAAELGTSTKVETVNRALAEIAARPRAALERLCTAEDDLGNPDVLRRTAQVHEARLAAGESTPIGFSVSTRPILGPSEGAAWDLAGRILAPIESRIAGRVQRPAYVASQRPLDSAARREVYDRCLCTPLATASGAPGNSGPW